MVSPCSLGQICFLGERGAAWSAVLRVVTVAWRLGHQIVGQDLLEERSFHSLTGSLVTEQQTWRHFLPIYEWLRSGECLRDPPSLLEEEMEGQKEKWRI